MTDEKRKINEENVYLFSSLFATSTKLLVFVDILTYINRICGFLLEHKINFHLNLFICILFDSIY